MVFEHQSETLKITVNKKNTTVYKFLMHKKYTIGIFVRLLLFRLFRMLFASLYKKHYDFVHV